MSVNYSVSTNVTNSNIAVGPAQLADMQDDSMSFQKDDVT